MHACKLLTQEFAWVEVPLRDPDHPEDDTKRITAKLPFIDPHEYLEYLYRSGRVAVTEADISHLRWH